MDQLLSTLSDQPIIGIFLGMLVLVVILVAFVGVSMFSIVKGILDNELIKKGKEPKPLFGKLWTSLDKQLTKATPIEKEEEIDLGHEYDGISELDNHLPPWWLALFYGSIIFAVVYLFRFHVLETAPLSKEEFEQEMAQAKLEVEAYRKQMAMSIDESNVEMSEAHEDLAAGKEVFTSNCVTCHGPKGEGLVGPNLTDKYWIHGGDVKSIFKTVKYGVPEKGMRAWQDMLSPQQMAQVSSYILSLQGTKPPNAKEPQGELYEPEGATSEEDTTSEGNENPADSTDKPTTEETVEEGDTTLVKADTLSEVSE